MLHVDYIPGHICNQSKEIDGVTLHSTYHGVSSCVIRFIADDDESKCLMLNFEEFGISSRNVELMILGTFSGNVWLLVSLLLVHI